MSGYIVESVADRLAHAEEAKAELLRNELDDSLQWKLAKESNGIKVFRCQQDHSSGQRRYKAEAILPASLETCVKLCDGNGPHRLKWDATLHAYEQIAIVQNDPFCELVHHKVKGALNGLVSNRESIDLVYNSEAKTDDGQIIWTVTATTFPNDFTNFPTTPGYVRVNQYFCGYVFFPVKNDPNSCRFVLNFCADIQMNTIASFMAECVKPSLMIENLSNLRTYVENYRE